MNDKVRPKKFDRHYALCRICKFPPEVREELEQDFLDMVPMREMVERYKDRLDGKTNSIEPIWKSIWRHCNMMGLLEKMEGDPNFHQRYTTKMMLRANETEKVKPSDGIKACELSAKLSKKLGGESKINVNILDQRFFGDLSGLSESDIDREISTLEEIKRQARKVIELKPVEAEVGEGQEKS